MIMETTLAVQAWYFTEATKAIAFMPPGHCLGALEALTFYSVLLRSDNMLYKNVEFFL